MKIEMTFLQTKSVSLKYSNDTHPLLIIYISLLCERESTNKTLMQETFAEVSLAQKPQYTVINVSYLWFNCV